MDQLNQDFLQTARALLDHPKIKELEDKVAELNNKAIDPEIWKDPIKAGKINKKLKNAEKSLESINDLKELLENYSIATDLNDSESLQSLKVSIEQKLTPVENILLFQGRFDDRSITMTLRAGAGGDDAEDWTRMLLDMYQNFFRHMEWDSSISSISLSETGGVKNVSLEVSGYNVYGYMQTEIGVHRLVRISPFNSGGTRETSFAQIEIIPHGLHRDIEIDEIDEKDLKWDYFMSSGKGGQSVNTTYSAVRLTHLPTKTVVSCQNERDQQQNKVMAMKYLKNRLAAQELEKQAREKAELRKHLKANEFGSQIRNYVLHPYKLVKDVRSGFETSDTDSVIIHGKILPFILSVKKLDLD